MAGYFEGRKERRKKRGSEEGQEGYRKKERSVLKWFNMEENTDHGNGFPTSIREK